MIGNPENNENWISIPEAAKGTPYSTEYLSLLARRGKLLAKKVGYQWYTTREVVSEYQGRQAQKKAKEEEKWLSMPEAACLTPYSAEYLSLLARRGRIKAKKIGYQWYTTEAVVRDYLKDQSPRKIETTPKVSKLSPFEFRHEVVAKALIGSLSAVLILISTFLWTDYLAPELADNALNKISEVSDFGGGQTANILSSIRNLVFGKRGGVEPKYIELSDLEIVRENLKQEILSQIPTTSTRPTSSEQVNTPQPSPIIIYQSNPVQPIIAERVVETIYRDFHRQTDRNADLIPQALDTLRNDGVFYDSTLNGAVITLSTTTSATSTNLFSTNLRATNSNLSFIDFTEATGTTLYLSGNATIDGNLNVGLNTVTLGQLISTRVPTLAHVFAPSWPSGISNASDATIYINPATAAADTNIFAAAVGGAVKFLVDAEGDVYANNLILSGSTSQGATTIAGNLTVQDSSTLGDAPSDLTTLNSQLLALASTTLQNFTFANATGTSATTTNFFATTASSTNLFSTSLNTGLITSGNINGQTISSATNLTGTLNVATSVSVTGANGLRSFLMRNGGIFSLYNSADVETWRIQTVNTNDLYLNPQTSGSVVNGGGLMVGSSNSPGARLQVSGGALDTGTVTDLGISTALTTGRTGAYDASSLASISTRGDASSVELVAGSSASYYSGITATANNAASLTGTVRLFTAGSERLRVNSSGNVGIANTDPTEKLDVSGSIAIRGTNPILKFLEADKSLRGKLDYTPAAGGANGRLDVYVDNASAVATNIMSISGGGNVGVGTTSPSTKLQVYVGASGAAPYLPSVTPISLESNGTNILQFLNTNTSEAFIMFGDPQSATAGYIDYAHSLDQMYFHTSGTYAFMNGRFGIGTSTPDAALIVKDRDLNKNAIEIESSAAATNNHIWGLSVQSNDYFFINQNSNNETLNTRLTIDPNGNVGIGTTGPTGTGLSLEVKNFSAGDSTIKVSGNGTSGNAYLQLNAGASANAYINSVGSGYLALGANGVASNAMTILSGGNVGIGTTIPATALEVAKTIGKTFSTSGNANIIAMDTTSMAQGVGGAISLRGYKTAPSSVGIFAVIDAYKENATPGDEAGALRFHTSNAAGTVGERMRIDSAGNVGVGTNNPRTKLEVYVGLPTSVPSGTGTTGFTVTDGGTIYGRMGVIDTFATNGHYPTYIQGGLIDSSTYYNLLLEPNGGNVGIGKTNPGALLDVNGTIRSNSGSSIGELNLGLSDTKIRTTDSTNSIWETWNGSSYFTAVSVSASNSSVGIGGASGNYRLTVGDSPNAAKLGVLNTGRSGGEYPSVGYSVRFGGTPGAYTYDVSDYAAMIKFGTSGKIETFTASSGTAGNAISFTAGPYVALAGTSWTSSSDVRLKENIETLSVLDRLEGYRAVSFDWKQGGRHDIGVIAQELVEIFPEVVVTTDVEGEYWGVNYDKLGALALQAAKELNDKIENIELNLSQASTSLTISTSTPGLVAAVFEAIGATLTNGVTHFVRLAVDFLTVGEAKADRLCLGETCVTETELKQLLQNSGTQSASSPAPTPASAPESEPTSSTTPEQTASTTPQTEPTASSTEPTTPTTEQPVEPVAEPAQATEPAVTEPQPEPVSETTPESPPTE